MNEKVKQTTADKTEQASSIDANKPLHKKITEAINKDDDLLSSLLKAISNPLVLVVAILALLFWSKQQKKSASTDSENENDQSSLTKLKKKNKQLKKQLKRQQQDINGLGKRTTSVMS